MSNLVNNPKELAAHEGRYARMLDNMTEGCQIIGFDWKYLYLNDAAVRHGNQAKENLLGATMMECYPGIEDTEVFQLLRRCMEQREQHSFENEFIYPDESKRKFHLTVVPDPEGIFISSIDISEKEQTNEKLHESRLWLDSLFLSLEEAVFIVSPQREIIQINPAAVRMFGYTLEELKEHSTSILHVDQGHFEEFGRRIAESFQKGEIASFEFQAKRKNGEIFPTEHNVMLLIRENGESLGIASIVRDISKQKRTERDLIKSEKRLRSIIDHSPDLFFAHNTAGRFVLVNENACRVLGYSRSELLDMSVADIEVGVDANQAEDIWRLTQEKGSITIEGTHRRKDGSSFPVEVSLAIIDYKDEPLIYGFARDLTERKRAEEALRVSEEKFRSIFSYSNVGIVFADDQGRILETNQAFLDLVGYSIEDLHLKSFRDITHPEDLVLEENYLSRLIAREIDSYRLEKKYIHHEGQLLWVDLGVAAIRDAKGDPAFFVAIVTDITEKMRTRDAIVVAEERYRTLFNVSPDGIVIIDPEAALPLQFNRTAHEQLGYTREEFSQLRIPDYEVIEDPEETRIHIEKIIQTGRDDFETLHRRKDGTLLNILVTVQVVNIGEQSEFVTVFRDITHIRRAEKDLESLSSRLLLATSAGEIGVWEWEVHSDTLTWNDQMYTLYGRSPDEFTSLYQFWRDSVHPEDIEEAERLIQTTLEGQKDWEAEFRIILPDGQVRHIRAAAAIVGKMDMPDYRMIGVNWDTTEQKESENRLRQARSHAFSILESTTDAFFEVDESFNLTYINSRAEKSLGLDNQKHLGENLWELFPLAKDSVFYDEYRRALNDQVVVTFEAFYQPFDTWYEIWAYPTPKSLSVYFHDVTIRKLLQEEREQIFELSLDMICVAGFDGHFKELNPSWERILGWSKEELMMRPWIEFVHPEDVEATIEMGRGLADGRSIVSFENRYRCKDGSYRWISWNSNPVPERELVIAVARDVTENIKVREFLRQDRDNLEERVRERTVELAEAYRDLLQAKEAAESANRVKTEFLANISHELRTPLNPIIGLTDYLQETILDDGQKEFLKDIRSAAGRLLAMIENLIELTRIESKGIDLSIQPFHLKEMFDGLVRELLGTANKKGLALIAQLSEEIPQILESDYHLLRRVVYLLLENAVKFTEHGSATLTANIDEDEKGTHFLHISVSDTGPGIPDDKISILFDDLSQADGSITRKHGGLGLGLTLARRIISGMHGKIWAENNDDGGCRFHIALPKGESCNWNV